MNKNKIIDELYRSSFVKDLLNKITSYNNYYLKDELLQELFVILCEMDDQRIVTAYENKYLNYLVINIVKNMYNSLTSPFYSKFRKFKHSELNDIIEDQEEYDEQIDELINKINIIIDNQNLVDKEIFNMYYKFGKYNQINGKLKDPDCSKSISSLRKIQRRLALKTNTGDLKIMISRSKISQIRIKMIEKIKEELNVRDN